MIGSSTNLNSIHIPTVSKGCVKAEFDSTYPLHLNGIISQEEFQQSIRNINRTLSSNKIASIIVYIIGTLGILAGSICLLVARATSRSSRYNNNLLIPGIILSLIGVFFVSIRICMLCSKRVSKTQQAVAKESMKYSTRSPIPCSWRLNIISRGNRGFGYRYDNEPTYNLVIDIVRFASPENINPVYYNNLDLPEPTALFGRQTNYPPPPYSAPPATGFCSRCGASRPDFTSKVCLSCEQIFNNY